MKISKLLCAFAISALSVTNVMAQQTYEEMEQLTVNEQVTTVITATEPIRFVDISTDKVVGDQPMNNTIRLKPKDSLYVDGEVLAIVTIVTERYRTQYALLYTTRLQEAVTDKEVQRQEMMPYNNPAVSMSTEEMTRFARQIWNSPARIRNVSTKQHRMVMRLNNIYSAGDYFFIDYSIENRTNIRFDIDQVRVKLSDKKLSKATNAQVIELNPVMTLEQAKSFKHGFRNVIVLKKMTFPNDKVLTIEILSISTFAQSGSGRVSLGTGLLYENGWDVTLAYEHETKYHNAWEFFGNVYLKWDECASCKHICPDSF